MTRLAPLLALVLSAAAAAAPSPSHRLTGSDESLWLVRSGERAFDLAAKLPNKDWNAAARDLGGELVTAAAIDKNLHAFFRQGGLYVIYDMEGNALPGLSPRGVHRWDDNTPPVAICAGKSLAGAPQDALVAIVQRPAGPIPAPPTRPSRTTAPATSPATAPTTAPTPRPGHFSDPGPQAPGPEQVSPTRPASLTAPATQPVPRSASGQPMQMVNLAVYEALGSRWEYVDETQGVLLAREHRILPTVVGDVLYILIAQGPDSRLLAWSQRTRWRSVPLGQALAGSLPLTALNVHGRLTLLAASPPAAPEQATQPSQPAPDRLQVSLHTLAIGEEDFTSQTIRLAGSPLLWSADALPTAAVLADQIALLWQEQGQTRMGYCDLSGEIPAVHESDPFAGPDRGNGDLYLQIFRYLLLAGAFTMMFLLRPRTLPKPFTLPSSQAPAPLASRFLAGLLDFLPFMFLASGAYLVLLPPGTNVDQHARQIMEGTVLPDALAWCVISGMMGFLAYSTLMEFYFQATLGKMLFRLRVVGDEGRKPALREVAARNLMKVIALSFSLFLLGIYALFMLLTRMRQGLGDMVARTTVTTEARPGPASPKPPEADDDLMD